MRSLTAPSIGSVPARGSRSSGVDVFRHPGSGGVNQVLRCLASTVSGRRLSVEAQLHKGVAALFVFDIGGGMVVLVGLRTWQRTAGGSNNRIQSSGRRDLPSSRMPQSNERNEWLRTSSSTSEDWEPAQYGNHDAVDALQGRTTRLGENPFMTP